MDGPTRLILGTSRLDFLGDEKAIRLTRSAPLRAGRLRLVYAYPGDRTRLIKIFRPDVRPRGISRYVSSLQNIRRIYKHTVPLLREWREWRREAGKIARRVHLQDIYGFVHTDLGLGMVVRAVRAPCGQLAPTLHDLILSRHYDEDIGQMVEEFIDWFLSSPVVGADIHCRNLVLDAEKKMLVLVDGSGDKTFLPVRSWLERLNQRSKRHYVDELLAEIDSLNKQAGSPIAA